MKSGKIRSGELVKIIDEHSEPLGIAIYMGRVVPDDEGIQYEQLQSEQHTLVQDTSNPIFYAIPSAWHHRLLVNGQVIHLNTSFFSVLPIIEEDEEDPV